MAKYWSSKSTSGVRFPPTSMHKLNKFSIILTTQNAILSSVLALVYCSNDWLTSNSFAQKGLLCLGMGFAVYWAVSIFVFLFKRSLYTSYTVVIQRYWKRALYLFWALELFLFSIYIYLILVAPTEVEWLLDQPQLFSSKWWSGNIFFSKLIVILAAIILLTAAQYALFNGNQMWLYSLIATISWLVSSVLYSDLFQTYAYSVFFSGLSWSFDVESSIWSLEVSMGKTRVVTQYIFLITILKFWHTVFITSMWLMTVMFVLQSPYIGQGALSSNKQNLYFLYGFAFIWICFLYKSWNNYLYEYVYAWFFVNPWGASLPSSAQVFTPLLSLL